MVITLSRQVEAQGEELARLIAEQAGLHVADRAILERIARREGLLVSQLAVFDEIMPGPVEAVVAEWRTSVSHGMYLRRLMQAVLALEREDNVLIVGRGAAFILTDPGTLHVRVVAPMPCRTARLVQHQGIFRSQAQQLLRDSDRARARFVRESFDADIDAPYHYDLVLNTAELALEEAAEVVLVAARRKSRHRLAPPDAPQDFLSHVMRFRRRPRLPRVSEIVWRRCERRSAL